jgi:periplasmic protein TonB
VTAKRARRVLFVALALSLFIHLIVALITHPMVSVLPNEPEVVSLIHRSAAIVAKPTPAPPRRLRTPVPRAARTNATSKPLPAKPQSHGAGPAKPSGSGGKAAATTAPASTATPLAASTTSPCAHSDTPANILATPEPAEIPPAVRAQGTSGIAAVNIQLDPQGNILGTSVSQSTGNASLDLVAVSMARDARYAPALHDCKPVAGAYTFSVKFLSW